MIPENKSTPWLRKNGTPRGRLWSVGGATLWREGLGGDERWGAQVYVAMPDYSFEITTYGRLPHTAFRALRRLCAETIRFTLEDL